jgi:hypothetical protein
VHILEEANHDPDDEREADDQMREDERQVGVGEAETLEQQDEPGNEIAQRGRHILRQNLEARAT